MISIKPWKTHILIWLSKIYSLVLCAEVFVEPASLRLLILLLWFNIRRDVLTTKFFWEGYLVISSGIDSEVEAIFFELISFKNAIFLCFVFTSMFPIWSALDRLPLLYAEKICSILHIFTAYRLGALSLWKSDVSWWSIYYRLKDK